MDLDDVTILDTFGSGNHCSPGGTVISGRQSMSNSWQHLNAVSEHGSAHSDDALVGMRAEVNGSRLANTRMFACIAKINGLDGCVEGQSKSPRGGASGGCAFITDRLDVDDDVAVHDAFGSRNHCSPGGTVISGRQSTSNCWQHLNAVSEHGSAHSDGAPVGMCAEVNGSRLANTRMIACIAKISRLDGCVEGQPPTPRGDASGGFTFIADETMDLDDVTIHDTFGSGNLCSPGGTVISGRQSMSNSWQHLNAVSEHGSAHSDDAPVGMRAQVNGSRLANTRMIACIAKVRGLDGCVEVQSQSPQGGASDGCAFIAYETVDFDYDVAVHDAFGSGNHCSPGGTVISGRQSTSNSWQHPDAVSEDGSAHSDDAPVGMRAEVNSS